MCFQDLAESPVKSTGSYIEMAAPTEPNVEIKKDGTIVYSERPRKEQPDIKAYIDKLQESSTDPKNRFIAIGALFC